MMIHAVSINRDHVHMPLSILPNLSVSRAVQYLKGRSSHKLLSEFRSLKKRYWGLHLWELRYWLDGIHREPEAAGTGHNFKVT